MTRPATSRIATAAALITLGNVASRLLGLVREQTIAALFGTTATASLFSAVSRVPAMVYDLLIGGAITAALIPVFSEIAGRSERASGDASDTRALRDVSGAVLTLTLLVLIPVVAVLVVAAPWLIELLGVGFAPDLREQGVLLTRVALPSVVLLGAAAVLMAVLYALQRVTIPSFAAAAYNLGIIACALLLVRPFGVVGLVIGLLVGAAAQLALQLVGLRDQLPRLSFAIRQPAVRRIMRLYAPVAAGLVVSAMVVVLDTRLASLTGDDSLAAMRYATQVVQLPLGLVATALSFAVLPVLSRYGGAVGAGTLDSGFRDTLSLGIRTALLLIAPMTVVLVVLREPVIALLFGYGAFGARDVEVTSEALLYYAPQLPFVAVDQLLIAAFYALQNTKLPVIVGVFGALLYAAVAIATVQGMGMAGLVLANSVQNGAHAVILFAVLALRHAGAVPRGLCAVLGRVGAAAALMALTCVAYRWMFPMPVESIMLALHLLGSLAAGGAVYAGAIALLGGEEVSLVRSIMIDRLRPRGRFTP
ncbi:MAG: murein biosynthesis integral membrane protein MurJ [Chloroflexota bacterium]